MRPSTAGGRRQTQTDQTMRPEQLEPRKLLSATELPTLDPTAAPSFGQIAGLETPPEAGDIIGSIPVASLIAADGGISNFHDPTNRPPGIAITGFDSSAGSLSFTVNGGQTWQQIREVSGRSSLLLYGDNQTRLAFRPASGNVANLKSVITFRAWNRTGHTNGATGVDTLLSSSQVLTRVPTGDASLAAAVTNDGEYGLIAERTGGLRIVDLSDTVAARTLATVDLPGATLAVAVSPDGRHAYTANDTGGMSIVDLTTPTTPKVIQTITTSGYAYSVASSADGRYVFVAVANKGLDIIDLNASDRARLVRNVPLGNYALGVATSREGRYALVTNSAGTLQVIDTVVPTRANVVRTVDLGRAAETVSIGPNGLAAVACGTNGICLVSTANPALASVVSSLDLDGYAWNTAFSSDGRTLFVANGSATIVVDVSSPAQPRIIGRLDGGLASRGIAVVHDGRVLVADFSNGSLLIAANQPNSSSIVPTTGGAKQVAVNSTSTLAFVADNTAGLKVVSIDAIGQERVVGELDTGRLAADVAISSGSRYVYVADTMTGLVVVDVADPGSPQAVAVVAPANAVALTTSSNGSRAYVADRFGGLYIYDINNPEIPQLLKTLGTGWPIADIAINHDNTVVAVAADSHGLEVYNVADPDAARRIARVELDGESATAVTFIGHIAYVATSQGQLLALDVSNTFSVQRLGTLDLGQAVSGLAASDNGRLYASLGNAGLAVIDVTLPGRPLLLGTMEAPGQPQGMAIAHGDRLLVAANSAGLFSQRVTPLPGFSLAADTVEAVAGGTIETRGNLSLTRTENGWEAGNQPITANGDLEAIEAAWQFLEAESITGIPTLFARHRRSGTLHRLVADTTWRLLGFEGIHNAHSRSLPATARGEAAPGTEPPAGPTNLTLPIELTGRTQLRRNSADELFADDMPLSQEGKVLHESTLPGRAIAAEALPEGNRLLMRLASGSFLLWRFDSRWQFLGSEAEINPNPSNMQDLSLAFGQIWQSFR